MLAVVVEVLRVHVPVVGLLLLSGVPTGVLLLVRLLRLGLLLEQVVHVGLLPAERCEVGEVLLLALALLLSCRAVVVIVIVEAVEVGGFGGSLRALESVRPASNELCLLLLLELSGQMRAVDLRLDYN